MRRTVHTLSGLTVALVLAAPAAGADELQALGQGSRPMAPAMQDWFPKAPPLPKPAGEVVAVKTVAELYAAAENVKPGGTILVADGRYRMPRTFYIKTDDVTLRSRSGDRTKVVLDFANCRHHELMSGSLRFRQHTGAKLIRIHYYLGKTVAIAKVHKQHPAQVAVAVDPSV